MTDWQQMRERYEAQVAHFDTERAKINARFDALNTKRFIVRIGHWFGALRVEWLKRQGWYTVDVSPVWPDLASAPIFGRVDNVVWVTMKRIPKQYR